MTTVRRSATSVCVVMTLLASTATAFVTIDRSANLAEAPRWSPTDIGGRGLADGTVSVSIAPGFATDVTLAVTGGTAPADVAAVEDAVRAAFAQWQSPVLPFTLAFGAAAVRGPTAGAEIDVFAVESTDPDFAASGAAFGVAFLAWQSRPDRLLTNGATLAGKVIHGADILIATDRLAATAPAFTREQGLRLLQRLLMHELGHAVGLGHPHDGPGVNFDTDTDPDNAMLVDPADPLATVAISPNLDTLAVLNQAPSDFDALFNLSLRNDDRGGRDVLYPALGVVQSVCQPMVEPSCHTSAHATLELRDVAGGEKDTLVWKWTKGDATTVADFGAPTGSTRYSLCLYRGEPSALVGELALAPGTRWKSLGAKGFAYDDAARAPHGVKTATLKAGAAATAKVVLKAKGPNVPDGLLPLGATPIVAQLVRADTMQCFASAFDGTQVRKDDGVVFKAKR